jgi:hypothetical protein
MSQDRLAEIRAIDPRLLLDVVRQDQRSPTFELLNWDVNRLSVEGAANAVGLFLFSGQGHDERGTRSWSVVLKHFTDPGVEQDPHSQWYWKRELLVAQSGITKNLPGSVVAPRFYNLVEGDGTDWLWMEYLIGTTPQAWTQENFVFAAQELGRFNGAYLAGLPLPDFPWLSKGHARTMSDTFPPRNAWDNALVRQFFPERIRERVMRLWDERDYFIDTLNRLPQTFSHFDYQRRNLFIRMRNDGQDEIAAIDWALCGIDAVGGDLSSLVGTSAVVFELDRSALPAVETAVFEAYITGLREAGWDGDAQLARLGYTAFLAIYWGGVLPGGTAAFSSEELVTMVRQRFGCSQDELASVWATICEFALDRADEARELMSRLG